MDSSFTNIMTSPDLSSYFFLELDKINSKSSFPLDISTLKYCSDVLSEHSKINRFFDSNNNRYQDKILGLSLLSSVGMDAKTKFRKLKEVADTSLIICGYFVESIDRKILGVNYYKKLGIISYLELDKSTPEYFDKPSFFKSIANTYDQIIKTFHILRATQSPKDSKEILHFINPINNSES